LASAGRACALAEGAVRRHGQRPTVTGYDTSGWIRLFAPASGAAGGLAGLIFVGLSVNMRAVLEFEKKHKRNLLTRRAIESLVGLLSLLLICVVALTPHIYIWVLAAFILLTAAISAVSPVLALFAYRREEWRRLVVLQRLALAFPFTACLLLCGTTLAIGRGGGLFWLPAAYVIAVAMASVNAWVLLVQVQRGIPQRATPDKKIARAAIRSRAGRKHRQGGGNRKAAR
jgi:hypothetical protein